VAILNDQSIIYIVIYINAFRTFQNYLEKNYIFIFEDRYSIITFQDIIPDSDIIKVLTTGEPQFLVFQKFNLTIKLDTLTAGYY
jgi:hypothetical protein